jgi:hypothetical protein
MFYAIVDKIVVTLQSLILYMVSTYDYCITVTQPSLEVCAKTVGHTADAALRALALCREREEG